MIVRTLRPYSHAQAIVLGGCLAIVAAGRGVAQHPDRSASDSGGASLSLPLARDVIRRHVEAVGGRAAILKLHSRYVWARFEAPARRVSGTMQIFAARPSKRLIKMDYPDLGTRVIGFDGERGWTSEPGGRAVLLEGKELAQLRHESLFDFDLHEGDDIRSMHTVGRTLFEGRPCYKLRLVRASLSESFEFFDSATGLFAGSIMRRETAKGPVTVKTVVSKYKPFDGVRLPARITFRSAGVEEVITVISVKHNRVDASVFKLPSRLRSADRRSAARANRRRARGRAPALRSVPVWFHASSDPPIPAGACRTVGRGAPNYSRPP